MFSTMPRRRKMLNRCHKVGDLVTVTDDRLNSGKAIGVIADIHASKWGSGISIYHVFAQGKEIKVLRSQIWDVNEER